MSTIPLARGFKPEKLVYPVLVSEKLDGVPIAVTVTVDSDGTVLPVTIKTRQGENCPAAYSIVNDYITKNLRIFKDTGGTHVLVGELYQTGNPYAPFKDTSGIVRRQVDAGNALSWGIFDYYYSGCSYDHEYGHRITCWRGFSIDTKYVRVININAVRNRGELIKYFDRFMKENPKAEGMIARSYDDTFNPGKRSWGYQKMLNEPTIDLLIVDFEEAVNGKTGEGKDMVGRLIASYKGSKIGIGPGKLTHKERTELWKMKQEHIKKYGCCDCYRFGTGIAQIKYKKDDSYDALRQPTFQHWRDDKTVADA